jgi:DNA helicase II / ATP-dependent DNA helicase PcrA
MSFREKLLEKFQSEYALLNTAQKQAVDKIYGPVMVVAGPGTGKTQILSVRIGKILIDTDANPSNILCLTYTDAGVLAMRKRLLSMIGPDAYSVNLHSYHSFCNLVIQQNMHLFHKRDLQPINELEQLECLMELIDSFKNDNPLKRYKTDAYYEARNLKELFSAMKREGWNGDWLCEKIDHYTTNMIPDVFANKTKLKKGIVELTQKGRDELQRMEKLKAAVAAFPEYQKILKEKQRYDFDDMISWVIHVFENNPDVLAGYQEQYQFILVDEYQDTSGSQNKLVELLISFWQDESPNVFVVGDDDQSIFRFQGANMENMMLLAKKYESDLLRVVLTENYRSTQPILNAAHNLIQNNSQRLCNEYVDLQKTLKAAKEHNEPALPVVRMVNNEFEENILIAEEVKKLVDAGTSPGEIAIIYKEHRTGDELQKFLQLQDIPVYVKRSVNLLNEPFIKKILSYFHYTAAENEIPYSGEHWLFSILHYDLYTIPSTRIAQICSEVNLNKRSKDKAGSLRVWLSELTEKNSGKLFAKDVATDELIRVHSILEKLVAENHNLPLLKWIETLFNEAGILAYVMKQPDKNWHMRLLNAFFNYVQDECRRNPDLDLRGLIRQIDLLEENKIPLQLVQTSGNDTGVNLLTCHGSKGLEYEYVFMTCCHSGIWEGKKKPSQGFKIPPNVFEKESAQESEEELRRLFFVAATRAKKHLFISFPAHNNEGKPLEASRFISEMKGETDLQVSNEVIDDELKLKYSVLRYGLVQKPLIENAEKDFIDGLLANFKMNVSALNNFIECPVKFYYNSLIRVPSAIRENAQFGSSMHDALSYYYNKMMEDKVFPSKEILLSRFQWNLQGHRQVFTPESLKRFNDYGVQCLTAFYDEFFAGNAGSEFIRTEVPLEALIDGIPLKGFADKIEYWGNDMMVTDFKTGSLQKSNSRYEFAPAGFSKKEEGGNYWRQAVFYKILIDNQKGKTKNLLGIEFLFLEPNEGRFDKKSVVIDEEMESVVKQQIKSSWERIHAHDFYTGCGKPDCEWCNFIKEHKLYTSLQEETPESEDESLLQELEESLKQY